MTVAQLADAAGVTRRAIRFYVQRGLLPPPRSRGRGARYGPSHLGRLQQIQALQAAGHSLSAIHRIVRGGTGEPAAAPGGGGRASRAPARIVARLATCVRLAEGVELQLDATRYNPDAATLLKLRECVLDLLGTRGPERVPDGADNAAE